MRFCSAVCLLLALCTLALAPGAQAWWCTGHMLVASVAHQELTVAAQNYIKPLLLLIGDSYPMAQTFASTACWADDLKSDGIFVNEEWHFANFPYVRSILFPNLPALSNSSNVLWAIDEAKNSMIANKASPQDLSRMLAFLIHFVGDIHQPLHVMTLFSEQFTQGDRGGNEFKITGVNQTNLHMFMDAGAGLWQDEQERPLTQDGTSYLDGWVDTLTTQYPRSAFGPELDQESPQQWANTSYTYGQQQVYKAQYLETPSSGYIAAVRQVCQRQVAIAGYRLADILNYIVAHVQTEDPRLAEARRRTAWKKHW